MSSFLISHELNQAASFGTKTRSEKFLVSEPCKAVVEKIKFDPLLV